MLDDVINIALQAGDCIHSIYSLESPLDIRTKQDNSPVTLADLAAHEIIVEGLALLTPELPILSEEGATYDFDIREKWNVFWLVDPLDGTQAQDCLHYFDV